MAVYRRFNGKKVTSRDPNYSIARWYCYKRIKGHKTIHQSIPEARTKEQAEQAERRLLDDLFDAKYGERRKPAFTQFCDETYLKYCRQHNANSYVIELFVKELKTFFGSKLLTAITPQDCRD